MKVKSVKSIKVKVRPYDIVVEAVVNGIDWGWQHAHKHDRAPDVELIKEKLRQDIMGELCEVLDFGDG